MSTVLIVFGAAAYGWLLPEFLFVLSPHADGLKRVPLGQNVLSCLAAAAIAYGVAA